MFPTLTFGSLPRLIRRGGGLFQGDAEAALLAVELTVGTITQVSSPTVPFGEVISQTPADGTSALTGSAVDLEVSIATLPSGDLIRPAVQITLPAGSVGLNEPITMTVSATDGGGIAATTVLINGTPVSLDANGMATFSSPPQACLRWKRPCWIPLATKALPRPNFGS